LPDAYIESEKHMLRCSIPMNGNNTLEAVTDKLETAFDRTRFKMHMQPAIRAQKHGSKLLPEVLFRLNDDVDSDTLYARAVINMLMRKVDPSNSGSDPMTQYQHSKSDDGRSVIVCASDEVCENSQQVMQSGMAVLSHLRHRFMDPVRDVSMRNLEVVSDEGNLRHPGKDASKIMITLAGDEKSLMHVKMSIKRQSGFKCTLTKAPDGSEESQLLVQSEARDLKGIVDIVRAVHLASGCHLPLSLLAASLPQVSNDNKNGVALTSYRPAVGVLFQEPGVKYNGVFVEALTNYVGVYSNRKADLHYPTMQSPIGKPMGLNLAQPVGIIFLDSYYDAQEALGQASLLVKRLKSLIEHDLPETQQEVRR
jgi:hypothetical protein